MPMPERLNDIAPIMKILYEDVMYQLGTKSLYNVIF